MQRRTPALLALSFCLLLLLSGCGGGSSSSQAPPPPHDPPLVVTTTTLPRGIVNAAYSATLSASGGAAPYAWNVSSGHLPPGLTLARTGIISGTPTAVGGFGFTVAVADSEQPPSVANANFVITIHPALQITSPAISYGTPNVYYSSTLAATGGTAPYTWAIVQGSLPVWATFNPTTGVISGTPTALGTTSFTVQATDSENPPMTATAALSIVIGPPPPRNAALYVVADETGLQIQSDGSLTLLPSSPERAITGQPFASSPTFPLLFEVNFLASGRALSSILVNPDYSLTLITSVPIPPIGNNDPSGQPAVDPTGSNLYLPSTIDNSHTLGVNIFVANGDMKSVGTIAVPDITGSSQMMFTPDGSLGFIQTCPANTNGSIHSYSRSSNGMLTPGPVYALPAGTCDSTLTVSPDGKYLADVEESSALPYQGLVQVYSIASDGTLTAVLPQPFPVLYTPAGGGIPVNDMTWDQSSSFLLFTTGASFSETGGTGVLSFSGSALTETVYPNGDSGLYLLRTGSWVYVMGVCNSYDCNGPSGISGYDFQNSQLTPLPGSPYPYGHQIYMVIY